jgi:hypothetical protein
VTVLDDGHDHAVVRIHDGTTWLAAHRPGGGGRAHGWVRRWELRFAVWRGHDGTYVVPWGRWYGVAIFTEPGTGDVAQWYVNCQDPLRRTPWGFDTMDRELDVVLPAPGTGTPRWKDAGRLARLVGSGTLPVHRACRMVSQARQMRTRLATPGFRAEIGRWLGPAGPPPALDRLLSDLPVPSDLYAHEPGAQR